jgi:head-tail adaptor
MRAGRLRHKASVYVPASTTNEYGEVNASFELLGEFPCGVKSRVKREFDVSATEVSTTQYDLAFRYNASLSVISHSSHVVVDGVKMQILSMAVDGLRGRVILMRCEERS